MLYDVFGQADHDSEFQRLGSIRAESHEAAQSISWHTFDGFRLVEMWLVPHDAVIPLDSASGAMDEGYLEAEADTLVGDPTDRKDLES